MRVPRRSTVSHDLDALAKDRGGLRLRLSLPRRLDAGTRIPLTLQLDTNTPSCYAGARFECEI